MQDKIRSSKPWSKCSRGSGSAGAGRRVGRVARRGQDARSIITVCTGCQAKRGSKGVATCCLRAARWLAVGRLLGGLLLPAEMAETTLRLTAGSMAVRAQRALRAAATRRCTVLCPTRQATARSCTSIESAASSEHRGFIRVARGMPGGQRTQKRAFPTSKLRVSLSDTECLVSSVARLFLTRSQCLSLAFVVWCSASSPAEPIP